MARKKKSQTSNNPLDSPPSLLWVEDQLCQTQADLFLGWSPFSGSFAGSGIVASGGLWMLDTSECPSDGEGFSDCLLLDILEWPEDWLARNPHRSSADYWNYLCGYFLSPLACRGILRRARARNRRLPLALEEALIARAAQPDEE